ncbi:tetratricopeptide repeat protein [Amantichitinum ursilacus]|uniref:Tetratricopeptide repeat protein n=1 Tax=Amantichitinum ursilacus TaxID=857265 RepID=A0A0N0GKR1_9NEIS|nr:hypothetical protein [Amantichitinum ursilacus]KPC49156.1 Tetratricopeptide repeat protein [Amantichitinum ursilacus]
MQQTGIAHIDALIDESERLTYPDAAQALKLAGQAVGLIDAETDPTVAVRALLRLSHMELAFGQLHDAQMVLLRALTIAETSDLEVNRGEIMNAMASIYYTIGEYDDAIDNWADCLDPRNTGFSASTRILAHIGVGQIYFAHEDFETALSHHRRAEKLAWQADVPTELRCRVLINVAIDGLRLMRLVEAVEALEKALPLAQQMGHSEYQVEISVYLATTALECEDLATAGRWLDVADQIDIVWRWGQNLRTLARGRWHLMSGNLPAALHELQLALELASDLGVAHMAFQAHHLLAQTWTRMGDLAQAEQHHRRYQEIFNSIVRPGTFARLQALEKRLVA